MSYHDTDKQWADVASYSRFAGNLWPQVIFASPVSQPFRVEHSRTRKGPAALWMAPSTETDQYMHTLSQCQTLSSCLAKETHQCHNPSGWSILTQGKGQLHCGWHHPLKQTSTCTHCQTLSSNLAKQTHQWQCHNPSGWSILIQGKGWLSCGWHHPLKQTSTGTHCQTQSSLPTKGN